MVEYDGFVMFPPRPKASIRPEKIEDFPGWWAQPKYNGTRTLIIVDPDDKVTMYTRHQEKHKQYRLSKDMRNSILSIKEGGRPGWMVLDGELMHNKTVGVKDVVVLYDILVYESEYLLNTQYAMRLGILCGLVRMDTRTALTQGGAEEVTGRAIAIQVNKNIWLAPTILKPVEESFKRNIDMDEIEGLVLKDPMGKLEIGVNEQNNGSWLVRVRKPHKNYRY